MNKYASVDAFLADLDSEKQAQVKAIRQIITATPEITEHIKWNAPSYVYAGEDRLTFNVRNKDNLVQLILHMGATRPENKTAAPVLSDDGGLMSWNSDIRGIVSFESLEDVRAKSSSLKRLIDRWLAIEV